MYNFIEKTGGRKAIYMLTKSVRAEEESNIKAARIRIARNLVKAGFDTTAIKLRESDGLYCKIR